MARKQKNPSAAAALDGVRQAEGPNTKDVPQEVAATLHPLDARKTGWQHVFDAATVNLDDDELNAAARADGEALRTALGEFSTQAEGLGKRITFLHGTGGGLDPADVAAMLQALDLVTLGDPDKSPLARMTASLRRNGVKP